MSARLHVSAQDSALYVLAHGAGGDMHNGLLVSLAEGLANAGVSCLRFNFPFSEMKKRAPDRSAVLMETWRNIHAEARNRASEVWVGGKSMGGRYASMMVADGAKVAGLVLLGYPLHAPGKTDQLRAEHWKGIEVPTLFIQGTSDPFARWDLLVPLVNKLPNAELYPIEGGGHSFERGGRHTKATLASTGADLARIAAKFVLEHS